MKETKSDPKHEMKKTPAGKPAVQPAKHAAPAKPASGKPAAAPAPTKKPR